MTSVSVLVCTHGSDEWRDRGDRASRLADQVDAGGAAIAYHDPDGTLAGVRNAAAAATDADWLCFLDADDALAPGYVAGMRRTMRAWNLARPTDLLDNPLLLVPAVSYDGGPPGIPAWHSSLIDLNCAVIGTLVPRRLFLQVGGFLEHPIYEDWDLWLRCCRAGARMVPVPDAVYLAAVSPGSRNQQADLVQETYWAIRGHHEAWFSAHPEPKEN